jgi:hypothetical protein
MDQRASRHFPLPPWRAPPRTQADRGQALPRGDCHRRRTGARQTDPVTRPADVRVTPVQGPLPQAPLYRARKLPPVRESSGKFWQLRAILRPCQDNDPLTRGYWWVSGWDERFLISCSPALGRASWEVLHPLRFPSPKPSGAKAPRRLFRSERCFWVVVCPRIR